MTNINKITRRAFEANIWGAELDLCRAVVRQLGGKWTEARENLIDVSIHGADGGFPGFVYTLDCVAFFRRNRVAIKSSLIACARELGDDCVKMVQGFRCLSGCDPTADEIGSVIWGDGTEAGDAREEIENALAWWALEYAGQAYVNAAES